MRTSSTLPLVLASLVAACSTTADGGDTTAPGAGGGGGLDAGGGGVSFGGAQDFGEFRAILARGEIPGPSTLDANGFFNEHYSEPAPVTCNRTLCLTAGLSVGKDWVYGLPQAALQIAVTTNVDPTQYARLPMNLVVVVDRSGSMAADGRLDKVKVGLAQLIDNLRPEDRMALISFDDTVAIDAPFGPVLDRPALKAKVSALSPRGGTNLYDGLRTGLDVLGELPPSDKQNRVIFLSDGLATAGETSTPAIIAMATQRILRGIGLTTIGVGHDFDAPLMRGLAERGAGNFYYVEDATAATEVFHDELDYFLSPLALDVRIEARARASWKLDEVVGTTLWSGTPTSGALQIPAVFLASRISQTPGPGGGRRGGGSMMFVGLVPIGGPSGTVADLALSYRVPGSTERVTDIVAVTYPHDPRAPRDEPYLSYPGMAERFAMYNMFLAFERATAFAADHYGCALAVLAQARTRAAGWLSTHEADQDLAADLALIDRFMANLRQRGAQDHQWLNYCEVGGPYVPHPPYDAGPTGPHDHGHANPRGCATGGGAGGLVGVAAVLLVVGRRRRRLA